MSGPAVRPLAPGDRAAWLPLWRDYCAFYETAVADEVTAGLWQRLMAPGRAMRGFAASDGGALVGFAHLIVHPNTWSLADDGYLEDLYVAPAARGSGAARALIDHLAALGRREGWRRLYWHTHETNYRARGLYDRVGTKTGFVRYDIRL